MRQPWRRWTLRTRLLLIGLLGLALAQAIGSVALYTALSVANRRAVDADAHATAAAVAELVSSGRLPATVPVTGTEMVQVVDSQGRVVSASPGADRLTPILERHELAGALAHPVSVPGSRLGVSSELRVIATRVGTGDGHTVIVAEPIADLTRSQDTLLRTLLISYPLLLALLGLIAWRVIGAALRPVEELRSAAERISGSGRDDRLPVPASRDEIHALAVTLNSMLDRLGAAREREQDLVADVAHELRSPLASMRLQTDVARRLGEGGELVDGVDAEVSRMSSLVDDLLLLARLDAHGPAGTPAEAVDVGRALAEVAESHVGMDPRVTVERSTGPAPVAWTRSDELRRILGNLVDNARRHATAEVLMSARSDGGRVLIRVDDDGPGIGPDDRERVFERFTRLDDARARDAGGSGLGLAIVRELARSRGGDVRLGESPAAGLRAEVDLPDARAMLADEE